MMAVVVADLGAQPPVAGRRAVRFDRGVFVGRDSLLGQLSADPVGWLDQQDPLAEPGGGQGCGAAAQPAPRDHEVIFPSAAVIRGGHPVPWKTGCCRDRKTREFQEPTPTRHRLRVPHFRAASINSITRSGFIFCAGSGNPRVSPFALNPPPSTSTKMGLW